MGERQSLATGFRNVDTSGDTDACHRCLDLIAGIPFFRAIKDDSFRMIAETRPGRVLDAGCGTGADLSALAPYLPARCEMVGLDASESLLARAAGRTAGIADRCSLVRGDLLSIPFHDRTFSACRIDRVLQHIRRPEAAIGELVRVLAPGGTLVAFDNDWETLSISLDDPGIARRIRGAWRDSFASGRVGRDLPAIFRACGLTDIREEPRMLVLDDLPAAEQVFDLHDLLARMVAGGSLTPREAGDVHRELGRRSREGTFSSGYTGFLVQGTKQA